MLGKSKAKPEGLGQGQDQESTRSGTEVDATQLRCSAGREQQYSLRLKAVPKGTEGHALTSILLRNSSYQ